VTKPLTVDEIRGDANELETTLKAVEHLQAAAQLLYPKQPYTGIEVLAAWHRGISTIEPMLKKHRG